MRWMIVVAVLFLLPSAAAAQAAEPDSDRDGLSDAREDALLAQFAPRFFIAGDDCSQRPARFTPSLAEPTVAADDGTIYGQASPSTEHAGQVELHYYHLWRSDCGKMGHPLDAEHVSALVEQDAQAGWKAVYWYAAAHEDTVCDASQITRAATVDAVTHGPQVWISRGKHASFLSDELCTHGCGGDRCNAMKELSAQRPVNLGEAGAAMNGATWVGAGAWPLADKLRRSDFPATRTARLERLPATDVAWANPEKRPMQAVILGGGDALDGGATGVRATDTALVIARAHTSNALGRAKSNTGRALAKSYRNVKKALGADAGKSASR